MNERQKKILEYWAAWIYEQQEDEKEMADYIVRQLGKRPLRVFEAACGGGKLCVPLALAGHDVTGIDRDENMLRHIALKAKELNNLHILRGDMLSCPWGQDFDAVILGANLLNNIVTDRDCKRAPKNLLERTWDALKIGGKLLIDFDCPLDIETWIPANKEWVCFEGCDDHGTLGRYIVINGTTNNRTRIVNGGRRWEITPKEGESFIFTENSHTYFPTLEQVCAWLYRVGFLVESINGGYAGEAFDERHRRAVIWARKITP